MICPDAFAENLRPGGAYYYRSIFARFMTMWKKQILARATETQNENWG